MLINPVGRCLSILTKITEYKKTLFMLWLVGKNKKFDLEKKIEFMISNYYLNFISHVFKFE